MVGFCAASDTRHLLLRQGSSLTDGLCTKQRVSLYSRVTINLVQKPASTETHLHWKLVLISVSLHQTVGAHSCIVCTSCAGKEVTSRFHRRCLCSLIFVCVWHLSWLEKGWHPPPHHDSLKGCSHSPEHRDYPLPLSQEGHPRSLSFH